MYKNKINFFLSCSLLTLSLGQVDYNLEIQSIFNENCIKCHGGSGGLSLGGLSLTPYNNVMNGGDSGNVVIPYDHGNSLLWQYVNSGFMPPPGNSDLTSGQVNLIAQWIDEGAFEEPGSSSGCTDPEAYSCADDDEWYNYIVDIGGIKYDNSCNWDWNSVTNQPEYVGGCEYHPDELEEAGFNEDQIEECTGYKFDPDYPDEPDDEHGYYNPAYSDDDGSCLYNQAPYEDEVIFEVESNGISIDWSAFNPPDNAILESYHIQRCIVNCTWVAGFNPYTDDPNTSTFTFDEFDWEPDVEIKYAIAVKYSNNPYWGWAIGASYITPGESCNLGDLNSDGGFNVLDIVTLANCVLAGDCAELEYGCAGDLNGDGGYNVLDIVTLVNIIFNP